MKPPYLVLIVLCFFPLCGLTQERIYRCGNEYTNTVPDAKALGCKFMESANVTVVQGTRPAASAPAKPALAVEVSKGQRVDVNEQKLRDTDARKILEAELKKNELRQIELSREYKQGAPDMRNDETRNPQKYQERVTELKASLARGESDLAGIRRELARMGTTATLPQAKN